ncbi:hypothetical protein KZX37_00645 [Microbacterium sp. EYE_5]|uniref:DUF6121 family protein n=1 Tax=unclassified Microbacterium TaxID=2609290 RepID=UPI00200663BE|nr:MULTISPECIES: DUF6121 family protein [unclassified Microbacterium]MCK6079122.1 hypothetical protein [Microbacterium sp. EYE_382]MCK6084392.1 hypothetical protein [Microbacterium sp. EYE_384]MCK6123379.1 hypothetical protein [Microbacterium sp. EYE_80]MCK6125156.1 hypothetical protein [Microbacterium sp. EYE_79]MCK6140076.1 hypothetical protein [Microbacterium sp. EYE_39]
MSAPGDGVRPPVAAFFATVGFAALAICGFGFTSLLTDTDVLATPGLGQGAGIGAMLLAALAFALTALGATRRGRYPAVIWVTVATLGGYLLGVVLGGALTGVDIARAIGAAGTFAVSWYTVVLVVAAVIAAWAGIALVRTRASRPEWPWERGDDEE